MRIMALSKDCLLKVRDNRPWKSNGEEYYRDLIVIHIDFDKMKAQMIINDTESRYGDIGLLQKELEVISGFRKERRCEKQRKTVVWVNSLHINKGFFKGFEEEYHRTNKEEKLWRLYNDDFELRNFSTIANSSSLEDIRKSCGFSEKLSGGQVMKEFLKIRLEKLKGWGKLNYSFAYCANKIFYEGLNGLTYSNSNSIPSLDVYRLIQSCCKAGAITYASEYERKVLNMVKSWDLSSAYPSQFVRQKMPIGKFYRHAATPTNLKMAMDEDKSFIVVIKVKNKMKQAENIIGICAEEKEDGFYYTLTDWDVKCFKLLGIQMKGIIADLRICEKKEYLAKEFRERVVEYYEEKQKTKGVNNTLYFEKKTTLDAIWGKGLQNINPQSDEDIKKRYWRNPARYLLPQWSLWGAAATRYEMIKAIVGIIDISIEDFVACDTDGIKFLGDHNEYFKKRNEEIMAENAAAGFPNCEIGTWKYEGCFENFIQLKKKVYAYSTNGELTCKFAGCSKGAWKEFFKGMEIEEAFERLSKEDFFIPASYGACSTYFWCNGKLFTESRGYKPGDEIIGINQAKAVQGM